MKLIHLARYVYAAWAMGVVDPTTDFYLELFHMERVSREALNG